MINQAPIVRYTASVSENFFPNSWRKTFSAESLCKPDPLWPLWLTLLNFLWLTKRR